MDGFQLPKGYSEDAVYSLPLRPESSWYPFDQPQKEERLTRPRSHWVALNSGPLDWESSALTNRPVFVFSLLIFNGSEICHNKNTNIINYQKHY